MRSKRLRLYHQETRRTALIIDAPPSETLITIRTKLDPDARLGVPYHLTLGDSGSAIDLQQAECTIRPALSLASDAKGISVLQYGMSGRWRLRECIPFTDRRPATKGQQLVKLASK